MKTFNNNESQGEPLIKEYLSLKGKRDTLEGTFRDIAWNFFPSQYESISTGDSSHDPGRYNTPIDCIGLDLVNTLASSIYSHTVSTGDRWFTLRAASEELNKMPEVAKFYSKLTEYTLKAIQNSNFSLMIHESLRMASCFGTGVLGSQWNPKTQQLEFKILRITDCAIAENSFGEVDTLFYKECYSPVQAIEKFGEESLPKKIIDANADPKKRHTKQDFIRCIKPRLKYDKKSVLSKDMPYMDTVVHFDTKEIVFEGGHVEFPYAVHRFDRIIGTPYGRSPAMDGLGTISQLNRMLADFTDGVEITLQPPVFLPEGAEDVSLSPGAVNQYDATAGGRPFFMNLGIDLNGTYSLIERYEQQLRDIFYVDKFIALENQTNMTATEVIERVNEKIQAISPVVSRLQSELLRPTIERIVRLLVENNRAPKVPEILTIPREDEEGVSGTEFKVEYTTRLDSKLAEVDTNNFMRAMQESSSVMSNIQEIPQLSKVLKPIEIIRMIFKNRNVDPDLLKSPAEIEEQEAIELQQQAIMNQLQVASQFVKPTDLGKAPEPGSPMEELQGEI